RTLCKLSHFACDAAYSESVHGQHACGDGPRIAASVPELATLVSSPAMDLPRSGEGAHVVATDTHTRDRWKVRHDLELRHAGRRRFFADVPTTELTELVRPGAVDAPSLGPHADDGVAAREIDGMVDARDDDGCVCERPAEDPR